VDGPCGHPTDRVDGWGSFPRAPLPHTEGEKVMKKAFKITLGIVICLIILAGSFILQIAQWDDPLVDLSRKELRSLTAKGEAGNADAAFCLSLYYWLSDPAKEAYWRERAATGGNLKAQYKMESYLRQKGADEEAMEWLRKSAAGGYAPAQRSLGVSYRHGAGVSLNLKQAEYWYTKAAKQGSWFAMYELSILLCDTRKDEAGLTEAYRWLLMALSRSYPKTTFRAEVLTQEEALRSVISRQGYDVDAIRSKAASEADQENRIIASLPKVPDDQRACEDLAK
jgi:TPR repeat protein